jgi:hypothetical protein
MWSYIYICFVWRPEAPLPKDYVSFIYQCASCAWQRNILMII